jgi:lipopolysaccharide transport system permease protein
MSILSLQGRLSALWTYRSFVLGMVAHDFTGRYLGSAVGRVWAVVNPLAQILIYTLVFSQVMQARRPGVPDALGYGLYLCAGLLTWNYFVEVLFRTQTMFLEQANPLTKVSFPRVTLPSFVFLSATVNFAIVWDLFLAFLLVASYQQIIVRQQWPPWSDLCSVCLVAAVFALISEALFRRLSRPMVDEL